MVYGGEGLGSHTAVSDVAIVRGRATSVQPVRGRASKGVGDPADTRTGNFTYDRALDEMHLR